MKKSLLYTMPAAILTLLVQIARGKPSYNFYQETYLYLAINCYIILKSA